jgi:hypothetical protein
MLPLQWRIKQLRTVPHKLKFGHIKEEQQEHSLLIIFLSSIRAFGPVYMLLIQMVMVFMIFLRHIMRLVRIPTIPENQIGKMKMMIMMAQ